MSSLNRKKRQRFSPLPFSNIPRCQRQHFTFAKQIFHVRTANISLAFGEFHCASPRSRPPPRSQAGRRGRRPLRFCGLLVCSASSRYAYYHVANGNISHLRSKYFTFASRTFHSPLANFTARAPSRPLAFGEFHCARRCALALTVLSP